MEGIMKAVRLVGGFVCIVLVAVSAQSSMAAEKISRQEEAKWLRWAIPLPKEISIRSKVELPASEVKITLRKDAGALEKTAADEMAALFKEKAEADTSSGTFEILIGVCNAKGKLGNTKIPDARKLKKLPNWEQAYVIRPLGKNRLALTALDERGVYYAAQTLRQLLESRFDKSKVTMPLVSVTDWPDLAERGEWGSLSWFPLEEVEWMARHKMNLVEYIINCHMNNDGRGYVPLNGHNGINPERIEHARHRALKLVPIISHFGRMCLKSGMYNAYPELKGRKNPLKNDYVPLIGENPALIVPRPDHPRMAEVLADFMRSIAEYSPVITCWLTESHAPRDQYAKEAKAYVAAWRIARRKYPELKIRILLSQGSYETNDKVLAVIPPEIGVTYYEGGRTYDSSRDLMIYPLLEKFAAEGRWLGVYPQLTAHCGVVSPWTAPQFIRYRMQEFVQKKLKCLSGYAVPFNRAHDFNVTAAAEWSWNSQGRDAREFALAYATRRRISQPEAFADWAVMLCPVSWDVYGSHIPYYNWRERGGLGAATMVVNRRKPVLGEGMFRYFPTVEHMDYDLAICRKAMAIAERIGSPEVIQETRVIKGYVKMVKEIYIIAEKVSAVKDPSYDDRVKLQQAMNTLTIAANQIVDGLEHWERALGLGLSDYDRFRKGGSIGLVNDTEVKIGRELASSFGIRRFTSPYFTTKVGEWTTEDFGEKQRITRKLDVTDHVSGPGTYEVKFNWTGSSWGARIFRVALASTPADDKPEKLTELSVDKHTGSVGKRSKKNVFTVKLDKRGQDLRYHILADIKATHIPDAEAGCAGDISVQRLPPADWDPFQSAGKLRPMTDKEQAKANLPQFNGKGLRVGVMEGGRGSAPILQYLRTVDGIDAVSVSCPNRFTLEACEVVVLPLLDRSPQGRRMAPGLSEVFKQYVDNGGGLFMITGLRMGLDYYGDICKFKSHGASQDYVPWIVVDEHPVSQEIEKNKVLPGTAFSVEYETGSNGTTVARSVQSNNPVVVAGKSGKGRVVICGMHIQLENKTAIPAMKILIENAVRWCGGQQ